MKSTPMHNTQESHLKLIKNNTLRNKKRSIERIYINTLIPGFEYLNNLGETITKKNVAFYNTIVNVPTAVVYHCEKVVIILT